MTTSRAAIYRRRGIVEVEQRPLPAPGPDELLVEVDYCGVCGSDLHLITEGWGTPGDVMGHEWSGVVTGTGPGVTDLSVGDRVMAAPSPRCGGCAACRAGLPAQCENQDRMTGRFGGAFATHVLRDRGAVMPVPDELDQRTAALTEPLAVALHAVTRSGIVAGEEAVVFGAGPIGALVAAELVRRGHRVVVVEPSPLRQELARRLGVAAVRHPEELPSFSVVEVDVLAADAVPVAFDTSGKRGAMESAFQQLRRGGRLVVVGTGMDPPRFDTNRMIVLELTVLGAFVYDEGGFDRAASLLASGALPVDVLIDDEEYDLDGVAVASERLFRGELAGKVMIRPGGAGGPAADGDT